MKIATRHKITQVLFFLIVAVFAAACGKKNIKQSPGPDTAQPAFAPALTDIAEGAEDGEGSLRNRDYSADPAILTVYFDFDKSELSAGTRESLGRNAAALKKRASAELQVAGHCDERGTTEYNLALAQSRANAVRNYYKNLGIDIARMSTISYGEERPVCAASGEECWSRNRRAETLIRTR